MKTRVAIILATVLALSSSAFAQSASTSGSSATEVKEEKSRFAFNILADAIGTSVGRPSSFYPTPQGQDASLTTVTNYLYFLYYLNEERSVYMGLVPRFSFQPVNGWSLKPLDPRFRIKWSNILATDGPFTMPLRLRAEIPMTEGSRDASKVITPGVTLYPTYAVPNSNWTLSSPIHAQATFYKGPSQNGSLITDPGLRNSINQQSDMAFVLSPAVQYDFSDKTNLHVEYNLSAAHYRLDPIGDFFEDGTDLVFRFNWTPIKSLTLTPKLTFYPGGKINTDSTTVGLEVFGQLI